MTALTECFWAGKQDSNNVVFVGYTPCDEVKALWADRIVVTEVKSSPVFTGQPPFKSGDDTYFPTGRWMALNRVSELFQHVPEPEKIMAEGRMLVDTELFNMIAGVGKDDA